MFHKILLTLLCVCAFGSTQAQVPVCQEVPFDILSPSQQNFGSGTISVNSNGELVIHIATLDADLTHLTVTVVGLCADPITVQVNPPSAPFTIDPTLFSNCFSCPNTGVQIQINAYQTFVLQAQTPVIPFTTCCTQPCVHSVTYWATHNRYETKTCRDIGGPKPDVATSPPEDTLLCSQTWLEILQSDLKTPWYQLAKQWITVQLNVANGATLPSEIGIILDQAEALLNACNLKAKNSRAFKLYTETLCAYNSGVIDAYPPLCCCGTLDAGENCVHDKRFWASHNFYETTRCNQIAWPIPDGVTVPHSEDAILCTRRWLQIMQSPADTDWEKLAQEWITAMLNQANGVIVPDEIEDVIDAAGDLLDECQTAAEDNQQYEILTDVLRSFNSGEFNAIDSEYPVKCCTCQCP